MGKPKVTKYDKHTSKQFDKKIEHMNGIVLFHHPGCVHCVMLKPKWDIMKKKLNMNGDIMEVNVTALETSISPIKNEVQSYPMIVRVENGKIKEHFKEERNIENMLKFVTHHLNQTNHKLNYNYKINHGKLKKVTKKKKQNKRKTRK